MDWIYAAAAKHISTSAVLQYVLFFFGCLAAAVLIATMAWVQLVRDMRTENRRKIFERVDYVEHQEGPRTVVGFLHPFACVHG